MKITKEICDRLLLANTKNRRTSPARIEAISRAMKKGWFIPNNGQTIVVTKSWDRLLDGQHRLYAIRDAGIYCYDIPVVEVDDDKAVEVFNTIDIVRGARTNAQVIGLTTNIPNSRNISAIIVSMMRYTDGRQSPSPSEVICYYEKYEQTFKKMKVYTTCSVGKIRLHASIWAGVFNAIILSGKEDEIIDRFHNILSNKCSSICDNLILNMIVSSKGKGGTPQLMDEFFKTTKALLNPSLKVLKMADKEDVSCYKAKNF